jgi:4-hydroxy-4-methyl-2-oxoglutarate aldolase
MSGTLDEATARALLALGTATVSEASGIACACDGSVRAVWSGAALCGPAYTVRCRPGDNLPIHHALERVRPGEVLVVDTARHVAGYWGEVLAVAAQARGVAGLVTNGGVRDLDALERLRFPAFAAGTDLRGTVKHEQGDLQVPLVVGGVPVRPGNIVLGDRDGVVILPAEALATTLHAARARQAHEAQVIEALRQGRSTVEIFRLPPRT